MFIRIPKSKPESETPTFKEGARLIIREILEWDQVTIDAIKKRAIEKIADYYSDMIANTPGYFIPLFKEIPKECNDTKDYILRQYD